MTWKDVVRFADMRNHMDEETDNLVAKPKERKDTGLRMLARMVVNRRLKTLVAKEGPHIVGYVSLIFAKFAKMKGNAYLTISVRASHRGKGLGTTLMKEAEAFAKSHKVRRIELEVFGQNPSIKLYERLGYQVEGRRKDAVEDDGKFDDVIFMAKFI
jgi:RimJ/RimL family protein N-acetyltransferase